MACGPFIYVFICDGDVKLEVQVPISILSSHFRLFSDYGVSLTCNDNGVYVFSVVIIYCFHMTSKVNMCFLPPDVMLSMM